MKIIVAEDDENSRILQHAIFEAAGHQVVSASNGRDAYAKIEAERPDIVVSDIMMPEMDGYALCRALKSNPDMSSIPFIFYSATFTGESDRMLAEELGGSLFLVKPMDPDEFLSAVEGVLGARQSARPVRDVPALDLDAIDAKYANALARKLDKKVTELKQATSELKSTQADFRYIQDAYRLIQKIGRMGVWDWSLQDKRFWWSEELYQLLGVPEHVAVSRERLVECVSPHDRDRFDRALSMAAMKAIPFHMEVRVPQDGNTECILRCEVAIASMDQASGNPVRVVGLMQDITQPRKVEADRARMETSLRQSQKIEALGSMAGSIAHDFKNILQVVQANAELLRFDNVTRPQGEIDQLDQIINACGRASDLAGQIMQFSRQEKTTKSPVSLFMVVEEVLRLIRPTMPAGSELIARLDPQSPAVLANTTQIHQVLMNLCTNALQAMSPSGGKLEVIMESVVVHVWDDVARQGLRAGRYVKLVVRDNGRGMDQPTRERIFEPYFTTRATGGGTGLGLSVVHGIVLEHLGQIMVESVPGRGSIFSVFLPVAV